MCNYEKIISALPEEFRGNLQNESRRSNPVKVEGENSYVVVIFAFNRKIEKIFVVRVEKDKAFLRKEFDARSEFDEHVISRVISAKILEDDYLIEFEKENGSNLVLEFIN